ncbi:DNA ligase (ATP) [Emmonsiellopsis sp. PD_33]|nr:DNA ligase (ATP) [Emmonsiellopsis sp. PD_33]
MTESMQQPKKTKAQLEQLVKANGGKIYQTNTAAPNTVCIADRRTVKVASLQKSAKENVIRPSWLFDCLKQNEIDSGLPDYLVPLEPKHMFFTTADQEEEIADNVDKYSDSYARDVDVSELKKLLDSMPAVTNLTPSKISQLSQQLNDHHITNHQESPTPFSNSPGWLFKGLVIYLATPTSASQSPPLPQRLHLASNLIRFAGGIVILPSDNTEKKEDAINDARITHVVVDSDGVSSSDDIKEIRKKIAARASKKIPHVVQVEWVEESWREGTVVDEERFAPPPFMK